MKKVLSVMAVSAFVLTAGVALAGGPGKKMDAACPEACQQQIDDLQSSQAQQNEELGAHAKQLENHEGRISALEADTAYFVRIGGRLAWMNVSDANDDYNSDMGWGGALAVGQKYGNYRYELELAYQGTDFDENNVDDTIDMTTVMANLYYDLPIQDGFSLYGMVGIGYGYLDSDNNEANAIAYKAGLGMSYMFTDAIAGDLGYEYLGASDNDVADSVDGHNVVASVRFMF